MLGLLVTFLCVAAIGAAAGIVFIVFGPVPVRRSVEMTPRMSPLPTAAAPIALGGVPVFDPAQATFSAPVAPAPVLAAPPPAPVIATSPPAAPVAPPARAAAARPATRAPSPIPAALAPVVRPRPAKAGPPPLPRTRSARGTDASRRAFDDQPTTTRGTGPSRFALDDLATAPVPTVDRFEEQATSTSQALPLELDDTFIHDGN